ncbi:hypothetical protein DPMN_168533 [Dreissena polymorpha]|uniref:Uncharacterized protein n=1 Tax=Dreissena polymorpha TaxID=45954 RepID=A0A9D4F5R6_DREPO|nr:hypothetical protein DPMN_168533 [Dreissena polymorpha]
MSAGVLCKSSGLYSTLPEISWGPLQVIRFVQNASRGLIRFVQYASRGQLGSFASHQICTVRFPRSAGVLCKSSGLYSTLPEVSSDLYSTLPEVSWDPLQVIRFVQYSSRGQLGSSTSHQVCTVRFPRSHQICTVRFPRSAGVLCKSSGLYSTLPEVSSDLYRTLPEVSWDPLQVIRFVKYASRDQLGSFASHQVCTVLFPRSAGVLCK